MAKTKVFISFDFEHDENIKDSLVYQSKSEDSPFSINDVSIKKPVIDARWQNIARQKIKCCDLMIVLCGRHTNQSKGVSAEVTIAQEEGIPYYLIKGRKKLKVTKPLSAKKTDIIYKWSWKNLKNLIHR